MDKWVGKFAVVTGASSGIGEAIVKSFALSGINVIGLARRSERIEEYAKTLGSTPGKIFAYKCDISDLKSTKEAFKWIEEKFKVIHILVNNAGVGATGTQILDEADVTEKLNNVINTNFIGLVHCTREAVRLIKKSDDYGLVVNVGSVLGHIVPFLGRSANIYAPTKYAVTATSEVLRQELILQGNTKIRVTNLSPGYVKTEMTTHLANTTIPALDAADIALMVKFLLEAPYNVNISQITVKPVGERA